MSRESSSNGNPGDSLAMLADMRIDDEQVPVGLGFLEQPEHEWSLLRHLFPSKAGGTPVFSLSSSSSSYLYN